MSERDWDERYAGEHLPWDTGRPSAHLVDFFERQSLARPRRVLEVGCGTGTNALWMAARGLEVVGIDIAPRAIAKAQQKRDTQAQHGWAGSVIFADGDFLGAAPIPALEGAAFDLVFDRGVLHVFDDPARQALFAARVAELLGPGGHWLCLAGSTEGPPREQGPPRRSVRDIAQAIEPVLEIVELRAVIFDVDTPARAWSVLSRKRDVPAQPSSRRG